MDGYLSDLEVILLLKGLANIRWMMAILKSKIFGIWSACRLLLDDPIDEKSLENHFSFMVFLLECCVMCMFNWILVFFLFFISYYYFMYLGASSLSILSILIANVYPLSFQGWCQRVPVCSGYKHWAWSNDQGRFYSLISGEHIEPLQLLSILLHSDIMDFLVPMWNCHVL